MVYDGFHLNNLLLRSIVVLSVVNPKDGEKASVVFCLLSRITARAEPPSMRLPMCAPLDQLDSSLYILYSVGL